MTVAAFASAASTAASNAAAKKKVKKTRKALHIAAPKMVRDDSSHVRDAAMNEWLADHCAPVLTCCH